ncbi:prophage integrase, putative [Babesia ovata]|uniref:Prophage integrase, putative n=1 Tax=Babesia ovata TaxID=189622 RepID=A0A2H6K8V9_9APIC|nr:prophage integrase, putative [Babesia ovata]GBE59421.1 prophage integrase, putative [Babesia ovata]
MTAECHILRETEVPGYFLNLDGQAVEVNAAKVTTSFGFKNHVAANIVRDDKIHDLQNAVRVCLIDDYILHAEDTCKDMFEIDLNDVEATVTRWCEDSIEFQKALYGALDRVKNTFVMVPGYENELCSMLCAQVENAVTAYIANKNDELKCSKHNMCELTLNFAFDYLNEHIMEHFRSTYSKQEDILQVCLVINMQHRNQNRIIKLRKEMNLNSTLNLLDGKRQTTNHNLNPSCEALKMMAQTKLPQDKLKHLARAIQFNKPESRDEAASLFILTLVASGLTDAVANYALVDMYASAKFCRHKVPTQHLDTFREGLQFLLEHA